MHNVISDNCKKIKLENQPTTNRMSELKAVLELTTTRLHTSWKTTAYGASCKRRCTKTRITDLNNLKHRIKAEWAKLDHFCSCASVAL